jgi:nucleotide-binding universal stress UspA family protein
MLKKILLALDGSENAERALPWAKRLSSREKALVVLVRVVPLGVKDDELERELGEARDYLQRVERDLNYAGVPTKVLIRKGMAAHVIPHVAHRERCDLILMTTRGGSPVRRWAIGGVTEQVMRTSSIPVLPVRSQMALPRQGHVRRLILPIDGSTLAESGVSWAARLAHLLKAKMLFVHVMPPGTMKAGSRVERNYQALSKRIRKVCDLLNESGVPARFALQHGDPADRIVQVADQNDLILTTTHGRGGFKRWIFGSVAEKLIHHSLVPVLVYKTSA